MSFSDIDFNGVNTKVAKSIVISILNVHGGCGKSTIASNLAFELSQLGKKVLLIDTDLLCAMSYLFNKDYDKEKNIYKAIINYDDNDPNSITNYIQHTDYNNLDIIINDTEIFQIEQYLAFNKRNILKKIMKLLIDENIYDHIIIDCNSTLGVLNENILSMTNKLIIPVELSAFGIMGLEPLFKFIDNVKIINKELSILGVLKNKVNTNHELTEKASLTLEKIFSKSNIRIFDAFISEDLMIPESQHERLPLYLYNKLYSKNRNFKNAFKALAYEIMFYI